MRSPMLAILFIFVALVASACGPPPTSTDPVSVIQAFYGAVNAGDVDGAMAFVADDAKFTISPGVATGKAQVRDLYQGAVDLNFRFELSNFQVEGDTVTWTFERTSDVSRAEDQAAEAVVQGGKIVSLTEQL